MPHSVDNLSSCKVLCDDERYIHIKLNICTSMWMQGEYLDNKMIYRVAKKNGNMFFIQQYSSHVSYTGRYNMFYGFKVIEHGSSFSDQITRSTAIGLSLLSYVRK